MANINLSPAAFMTAIIQPEPGEITSICPIKESGAFWSEVWEGQKIERSKTTYYYVPFTLKESAWEDRIGKRPKLRRRKEDVHTYYAVILDDVGTKVKEPALSPSYKLLTSPGNEQWGYIIQPESDMARVNGFLEAMKEAGLSDEGAVKMTQPFRMPGSWHYTHKMRARIVDWHPERVWDLEELGEGLGFKWGPLEVGSSVGPGIEVSKDFVDPVYTWLKDRGMIAVDGDDWVFIHCPWIDQHGKKSADTKYSPMGRGGSFAATRGFKCFHESCDGKRDTNDFLAWVTEQGGPIVRASSAEGRAVLTEKDFFSLFPPVRAQDLPDMKVTRRVVDGEATFVPAAKQLPTMTNYAAVIRRMGIDVRLNLMLGDPEMVPPENARSGYYSIAGSSGNDSVYAAVETQCHKLGIPVMALPNTVTLMANLNKYHPVEEWIQSREWSGHDFLSDLLDTIHLQNPKDIDAARLFLRKWSIQVVEAVRGHFRLQAKDKVLTFTGPQGCGKTTWIESLMPGWVTSGASLHLGVGAGGDRDSIKKATRAPIVELGELDATFRRSDISQLKSFLSCREDVYRPAYGKTEIRRPRSTAYAGSVNSTNFLVDVTGNRRYLVLPITRLDARSGIDMQQYWAQVSTLWASGESYFMTAEEEAVQDAMNLRFISPSEPEDLFWSYFGGIIEGTDGGTKPCVVTVTNVANILGCRKDRGTLSELSGWIEGEFRQQKRQIAGVRNAWLLPIKDIDSYLLPKSGLEVVKK